MGQAVSDYTDATFEAEVLKATTTVLVDFGTLVWALPMIAPFMDWAAETYDGKLQVGKLEVDGNPPPVMPIRCRGFTLILFRDGKEIGRQEGAIAKPQLQASGCSPLGDSTASAAASLIATISATAVSPSAAAASQPLVDLSLGSIGSRTTPRGAGGHGRRSIGPASAPLTACTREPGRSERSCPPGAPVVLMWQLILIGRCCCWWDPRRARPTCPWRCSIQAMVG